MNTLFNAEYLYEAPKEDYSKDYIMQQTMIRVKDPKASLEFYINVLGFNLVDYTDMPQYGFSVYFVALCDKATIPSGKAERGVFCRSVPACVELTWNHGSENKEGRVYNSGNADTTGAQDGLAVKGGFGHLGVSVPDVYVACERFKSLGVEFHKSPNSGGMKGLAFIKDPDGYLIEIIPQGPWVKKDIDCNGVALEGGQGYKDNSKS